MAAGGFQRDRFIVDAASLEQLPSERGDNYTRIIGSRQAPLLKKKQLRAENIFGAWSDDAYYEDAEQPLYTLVNNALYEDDAAALSEHADYILSLKRHIKYFSEPDTPIGKLYRGVRYTQGQFRLYCEHEMFLWPNFAATSRDRNQAQQFGSYMFVIDTSLQEGTSFYADISAYSKFGFEQEVLFYPYSGFEVVKVHKDARTITLKPVDTHLVEEQPECKSCGHCHSYKPTAVKQPASALSSGELCHRNEGQCSNGHALSRRTAVTHKCHLCKDDIPKGHFMSSCHTCNWYVCSDCEPLVPAAKPRKSGHCPKGHSLRRSTPSDLYNLSSLSCDGCGKKIQGDDTMSNCGTCGWDACAECEPPDGGCKIL